MSYDTALGCERCGGSALRIADSGECADCGHFHNVGVERVAVLFGRGITAERVEAYLPSGYRVVDADVTGADGDSVIIAGVDHAGWTLDGYVLPRLASGGIYGSEES